LNILNFTHENRFVIGLLPLLGVILALSNNVDFDKLMVLIFVVWTSYESVLSIVERHNYVETILSYVLGLSGMLSSEVLVRHFVVNNDYAFDTKIILALVVFVLFVINGVCINVYMLLNRKME
jgi:hypothetical protein